MVDFNKWVDAESGKEIDAPEPKKVLHKVVNTKEDKSVKVEVEEKKIAFKDLSFEDQVRLIETKLLSGKSFQQLPLEEQVIWLQYEKLVGEQQAKEKAEQALFEQQRKAGLIEEFDSAPETEKLRAGVQGKPVSPDGLKQFLAKTKVGRVNKKARRKGGEIIIKGNIGKGYEIVWSKNPVRFVEFFSKNEQGELVRNVTRITKTKGHLKGSSIPVHLCLEGVANSIDPFEGIETNMSAEYYNKLLMGQWQSGYAAGVAIKQEGQGMDKFAKFMPILMLVVVGCLIILIYMMSQIWEKIGMLT
ncbi:MAG: hypothetical protein H7836_10800 [Magnetococcus sp. YQC-3]